MQRAHIKNDGSKWNYETRYISSMSKIYNNIFENMSHFFRIHNKSYFLISKRDSAAFVLWVSKKEYRLNKITTRVFQLRKRCALCSYSVLQISQLFNVLSNSRSNDDKIVSRKEIIKTGSFSRFLNKIWNKYYCFSKMNSPYLLGLLTTLPGTTKHFPVDI